MQNPLKQNDLLRDTNGQFYRVHKVVNSDRVLIYEVSTDAQGNPTTNIHPERGEVLQRAVFVYGSPGTATRDGRAAKLMESLPDGYVQALKRAGESIPQRTTPTT